MTKKKAAPQNSTTQFANPKNTTSGAGPKVTGQIVQVLAILRQGPTSSLEFIHEHNILRAQARIRELRQKRFNIKTHLQSHVQYRGHIYQSIAIYVLGQPEWPAPSQSDSNSTTS